MQNLVYWTLGKVLLELEQQQQKKNTRAWRLFKPLLRGRLTYLQPCPTEDKVSKLISLLTKLLALRVELFCPVVYECDAWVPLLTKVFCFSDKEFFISFEFYLFILLFILFLSVWLSPRTLHSSFSEQPRKNRVSVKVRLGVGVGVGFFSSFFSDLFVF